jgi:hypothetical protein
MGKWVEDVDEEIRSAGSKADFVRLAGIGTELADFVIALRKAWNLFFNVFRKTPRN